MPCRFLPPNIRIQCDLRTSRYFYTGKPAAAASDEFEGTKESNKQTNEEDMSGLAKFFPGTLSLISKAGEVSPASLAGKTVFFYFSASWCPPCRGFTPTLAEFYTKFHTEKNFEVVFVTWDEEVKDFEEYYKKMPWLAIPFASVEVCRNLTKTFNVNSIPTLIAVNADTGAVIGTQGRVKILDDPEGKSFPWAD